MLHGSWLSVQSVCLRSFLTGRKGSEGGVKRELRRGGMTHRLAREKGGHCRCLNGGCRGLEKSTSGRPGTDWTGVGLPGQGPACGGAAQRRAAVQAPGPPVLPASATGSP